MQRRSRRTRWLAAVSLLAAAALLIWFSGIGAHAWQAGKLLADIARGQTNVPIDRLPHPLVRTADGTALSADHDDAPPDAAIYPSDLYLPPAVAVDDVSHAAGMVLVPGASPGGKDDPRLIAFAEILAAAGFVVLVPDLPGLRLQQVNPTHADDIAAAATYLAERLNGKPVAVAAISYAVGPAVLAAVDQTDPYPIALILGIGGYYDAVATTVYITTGWIQTRDRRWEQRTPNEFGKWAFIRANLPRISSPHDRDTLGEIARLKLHNAVADVSALSANLGPEGTAVWQLLQNTSRDRVADLIGMLPPRVHDGLTGLDLASRDLSNFQPTLLLVHGADDPILPPEGSIALAGAVPHSRLYLIDALTHVELSLTSLDDAWALYRACWSLIGWRDRLEDEG